MSITAGAPRFAPLPALLLVLLRMHLTIQILATVLVVFAVAVFLSRTICAALKIEPPISKSRRYAATLRQDGQMVRITKYESSRWVGDGLSAYEAPSPATTVSFSLGEGGSPAELEVRLEHVRLDGGSTLRFVEHRWPRWWQRIFCPGRAAGDAYYVCPRDWVAPLICTQEELAALRPIPALTSPA